MSLRRDRIWSRRRGRGNQDPVTGNRRAAVWALRSERRTPCMLTRSNSALKPHDLDACIFLDEWIDFRAQDSHTEREYCSSETMIAQGTTVTRWCRDKRSWLVRSAEPDSASDERRRGEQFDNRHQCSTTEGRSRGGLSGLSGRLGSTALHCGGLSRSAGSRRLRGAFPRGAKGP